LKKSGKAVDIITVIDTAIEQAQLVLEDSDTGIVAEYPAYLPSVLADEQRLGKVLITLLHFALKNTHHTMVSIRAQLINRGDLSVIKGVPVEDQSRLFESGPWVWVSISDNCEQISQYANIRLLDVIERTPQQSEQLISLTDCQREIVDYGGLLWIEFEKEIGLNINVLLQLKAVRAQNTDASPLQRVMDKRIPVERTSGKSLLLLVGNDYLGKYLSHYFADEGFNVRLCVSAEELLSMARRENPDLILLDMEIREPAVFDLAMILQGDSVTGVIPMLFLTTMTTAEGQVKLGAVDFMLRPVGTGKLISIVNEVLEPNVQPNSRVLIVEPNKAIRSSMIMVARDHGYRVTEAEAPEEALALAEHLQPGMVIVNAVLARDRDYWLIRNLRMMSEEIEIMVLADNISDDEGKVAVRRGASGYSETGKLPELLNHASHPDRDE